MANVPSDHAYECIRKSTREMIAGDKAKYVLAMSADLKPTGKRYITLWGTGHNGAGEYKYIHYYQDGAYQTTEIITIPDVAGSLGGKYFKIYGADDSESFYVWFNVGGGSIDPAVADHTGIEIGITADDTAETIASNIVASFNNDDNDWFFEFKSELDTSDLTKLTITERYPGPTTASVEVDSGFTISEIEAGSKGELIRIDKFNYDSDGEYVSLDVEDIG